jgi:predicted alpha/beta-hydrolase family hydrolase
MKQERIVIKTDHHESQGILLLPDQPKKTSIILAHGAGKNMDSPFMSFFHEGFAKAGYPSLKFNFPYMQKGKKVPDPQPVLTLIYRKAIEMAPSSDVVIGGKSMGGRIASYVADEKKVNGLVFLGYPLHPPGKPDQLRDQHLYSIRKPMLFVSGTRDPFATSELLTATLKKIGKYATFEPVEGGGHSFEVPKKSGFTTQQIWDDVLQKVLNWLVARTSRP